MDNLDVEIELHKLKDDEFKYYRFFIDKVEFIVEYYDSEFEKQN